MSDDIDLDNLERIMEEAADGQNPRRVEKADQNKITDMFLILLALLEVGVVFLNIICLTADNSGYFATHLDCKDVHPASENPIRALGFWIGWTQVRANFGYDGMLPSYPLSQLSNLAGYLGALVGLGHICGVVLNFSALVLICCVLYRRKNDRGRSFHQRDDTLPQDTPSDVPLSNVKTWLSGQIRTWLNWLVEFLGLTGKREGGVLGLTWLCRANFGLSLWLCGVGLIGFYFAVTSSMEAAIRDFYENSFSVECGTRSRVVLDYAYVMTGLSCLADLCLGVLTLRPPQQKRSSPVSNRSRPGLEDKIRGLHHEVNPPSSNALL